ncbi:MAG: ABC transporter substrate-binding protein [Rhizobiales bacterium]|nr:ABC transporter substrate-binding protein [Hyphomicrobiales bacterium]
MEKRVLLRLLAAIFTILALGIAIGLYLSMPTTLRIAVGPEGTEQARFVHAVQRAMIDTRQPFRLDIRPVLNSAEASKLLDKKTVDLAVARSDDPTSNEGRSVAVLQKRSIIVVGRKDSGIESVTDLRGRNVALLGESDSNLPLIERIFAHYEIQPDEVKLKEMRPADVANAMADGQLDAFILVIDPNARMPRRVLAEITEKLKIPLIFMGMPASEALAFRFRDLITTDIPAGVFGGTPPRPEAAINTVAISYELISTERMSDTTATALTKSLLELRTRLRRDQEISFGIETPPVDEPRRFLPHDGTAALVNDDAETFLEKYSDAIWLSLFGLSLLGSSVTGFMGWASGRRREDEVSFQALLPQLTEKLAAASSLDDVDEVQREFDALVVTTLMDTGKRSGSGADAPDPTPWITLFNRLIASRRAALERQVASTIGGRDGLERRQVAKVVDLTPRGQ